MRINLIITLIVAVVFFACGEESKQSENVNMIGHKVEVEEVIQAKVYTYLRVKEDSKEYWMAVTKDPSLEAGSTIYYKDGLEMTNFESRDLERTFETIYFIQEVSSEPYTATGMLTEPQKPKLVKQEVDVQPVSGGITISELYSNRDKYGSKVVKIKGKVTKFNSGIMDRNWVHLQDGTNDGDYFDLTVTTKDEVRLGQVVVFEGRITLNKDFGAGYSYEVIMEDSKLVE